MNITAQQVQDEAIKIGEPYRVHVHCCSMCGYPCGYNVTATGVSFDAGCDCTRRSEIRESSFQDIASWINMQSREDIAEKIWRRVQNLEPVL